MDLTVKTALLLLSKPDINDMASWVGEELGVSGVRQKRKKREAGKGDLGPSRPDGSAS